MRAGLIVAVVMSGVMSTAAARQARSPEASVDEVMNRWTSATPGCAVGVSQKGQTLLERAYGMADLEHDVRNTPATIFEAGSVSKQFTAAAILLLARDGKLSLDDPARRYITELPDYGAPLTIRHMLNHTSGLRDWGSVAAIAGWPRTTRVHTHAHVLDIVGRQRALNFPTGTRWSYSNTGYNLAAIIVARVSGQSFAEFTRARIFAPLGMTRTSWRDDYTRVVKDRAIAYAPAAGGFAADMPFENVHGNGGLLTTVGDLLRWTRGLTGGGIGDATFAAEAATPGRFNDGQAHDYALGLRIGAYRDVPAVSHSGATAGYRAYLVNHPDRQLAIAVLCNAANANPTQDAQRIADAYLGLTPPAAAQSDGRVTSTWDGIKTPHPLEGTYRRVDTGEPAVIVHSPSGPRLDGALLQPQSALQYRTANGVSYAYDVDGALIATDRFGRIDRYLRVAAAELAPKPLDAYVGTYSSDEAEVDYVAAIDGDALVLKRRPDAVLRLTPVYADAFRSPLGFIRFHRNAAGVVTGLSVSQDRVWDLPFRRQP